MTHERAISRRRFLLGAGGAALAVPLLPERTARGAAPPPRVVFWYWPEGVIDEAWWPAVPHGASLADPATPWPQALRPLQPHRADLTLVRGVEIRKRGRFEVAHDVAMEEVLTGVLGGSTSVDQTIARAIAGDAPLRSYQLGVSTFGDADNKLQVSFDRPGAGRPAQNDPVKAFDDLVAPFAADPAAQQRRTQRLALRRSVLDAVLPEYDRLRCQLGRDGKAKLDAHADGIRSVERTLDRLLADARTAGPATIDRALATFWKDLSKHPVLGAAQLDVMVAALAADVTRVLTLQWSHTNDNNLTFPWLDITYKQASHHALSHEHDGAGLTDKPADKAQTRRDRGVILQYWAQQLAGFVTRLKSIPEGSGTLFDSVVIVGFSEQGSNNHRNTDIPFFLLGSGGRRFVTGRAFNFKRADFRSHNDVLAALAHAYDARTTAYGDREWNDALLADVLVGGG